MAVLLFRRISVASEIGSEEEPAGIGKASDEALFGNIPAAKIRQYNESANRLCHTRLFSDGTVVSAVLNQG